MRVSSVFTIFDYFLTLKIEKTRRLNFVLFSALGSSETKLRNDIKLSETKLSGDSIFESKIQKPRDLGSLKNPIP